MRLRDNAALSFAAQHFPCVVPVFVHDTDEEPSRGLHGAARVYKHESLRTFQGALARLGSGLVLRRGAAAEQLLAVLQDAGAGTGSRRCVALNWRLEPWHVRRDKEVVRALTEAGVEVRSFTGNVLYDPEELRPIERWQRWRARVRAEEAEARGLQTDAKARSGVPKDREHISGFGSYRFFHHALEELGPPPKPCATVQRLPPLEEYIRCTSLDLDALGYGESRGRGFAAPPRQCTSRTDCTDDWAAQLRRQWPAGEDAALARLERFLEETLAVGDFEGRRRLRADAANTSELSPYIRFGELSARTVYWAAKTRRERTSQKLFEDPLHPGDINANATFLRRFVWRDLSYWFLAEFPYMAETSLRPHYEEQVWTGTARQLRRWQQGKTGFPLVDAAMRQLWSIGWMPNYLRHVVAQTLIEYMDITWKDGLKWFAWTLVDADVAINSFMWQNGGHSGPDQWEFVLHPVHAAKSCDPEGSYVRRWVPEVAGLPTQYLHRPWEAPPRLAPPPRLYPPRVVEDLDAARRSHAGRVIDVRRRHPEIVARTGHEWLKLPGRGGLLAKLVTRDEFRAETKDFIFKQTPGKVGGKPSHRRLPAGRGQVAQQ